jgi:hypothetical protein
VAKVVDIGGMPELVRLAEEVRATHEPHVLRSGGQDLAVLTPVEPGRSGDLWAGYDPDAVRAAIDATAGSWADLDVDAVIAHVYRAREEGSRPADRP